MPKLYSVILVGSRVTHAGATHARGGHAHVQLSARSVSAHSTHRHRTRSQHHRVDSHPRLSLAYAMRRDTPSWHFLSLPLSLPDLQIPLNTQSARRGSRGGRDKMGYGRRGCEGELSAELANPTAMSRETSTSSGAVLAQAQEEG